VDHDSRPAVAQILAKVAEQPGGMTPRDLVTAFEAESYSKMDIIKAIQRAFDQGLLRLSTGARLIVTGAEERVAA
jgi:hypothetical protein